MNASYSLAANLANDLTFATLRGASFQFLLLHTPTVFYYYLDGKGQNCRDWCSVGKAKCTNGREENVKRKTTKQA